MVNINTPLCSPGNQAEMFLSDLDLVWGGAIRAMRPDMQLHIVSDPPEISRPYQRGITVVLCKCNGCLFTTSSVQVQIIRQTT